MPPENRSGRDVSVDLRGEKMWRKRFTPEQIISKLREAEVETSRGMTVAEVVRKL